LGLPPAVAFCFKLKTAGGGRSRDYVAAFQGDVANQQG
jgi:hypothetical protein